jgi:hypothetical protein
MKAYFLSVVFILVCFLVRAQENISVSFNNSTYKEVLETLEQKINKSFFYSEEWFSDTKVTKTYSNKSLEFILDNLFIDESINFFEYDNRIILTKNTIIYSDLAQGFYEDSTTTDSKKNRTLFFNEYNNRDIITLGKQNESNTASAYTISGNIVNLQNNKPVADLLISIENTSIRTTTDANGNYALKLPYGYNKLTTKLFGFSNETKELLVFGNGKLNLKILESAEFLTEVNISAIKDDNIKKAKTGVTKIDVENIKNIPVVLGERDILKVATTLPGISTAGEGSSGFNVRGGREDQNLILLDDAVIYNPAHFLGFFSAINPFVTGSIEIYKASIPAEFGGRLSSVFDIKSKDANYTKLSGEGAIGPVTSSITVQTPIIKDKSALTAAFRATYSDWILKALDEESLKNSEASFYDGLIKYNHKINENNTLQLTGYYSKDKYSLSSDSIFKYSNALASLKWAHQFRNEKHNAEIIASTSNYNYVVNYEALANRNFDFNYNINESQLKLRFNYLHSKIHKFSYGINTKIYNNKPGEISPIGENSIVEPDTIQKEKAIESAVYISDLFAISEKLLLDVGLRFSSFTALGESIQNVYIANEPKNNANIIELKKYDKNEAIKTYGGFEPRVSARYLLTPSVSVKVSFNSTIQYLHLLSNNTTVSPTDTWKLSDLNIEPQRAQQYSLGVYKNIESKNLEISLEGYYKKSNNILDYKIGADLILNNSLEQELLQGEGKAYGVEFLIKKTKGRLNGWFGYSYSRAFLKLESQDISEQVNNGDYFPTNYDKPHDFSVVANYKLTKRYSISTNLIYQTGRPITYPIGKFVFNNSEQTLYSDRNQFRIPDYYRLDIGVNIEGNHKLKKLAHSFWNVSVYNVLGRNNPYSVNFRNVDGKVEAVQTSIFAIPIPTVTYNFKF